MCASPLDLLRAGPPPPRVALLSDSLFFMRAVAVSPNSSSDGAKQAAEVAGQVELALEALSPFPLLQLYYGHYWHSGASHALVFAAYRRRFTAEQIEEWSGADLVIPRFAALLGADVQPSTTALLNSPEGLTAIHWDGGSQPSAVSFRPLAPEPLDEERTEAKQALLRQFESRSVVELESTPVAASAERDSEWIFASGEFTSHFPAVTSAALDVRDKEELGQRRRAHTRDLLLWRVGMGCVALFVLLALAEFALVFGGMWQKTRNLRLTAQSATVEKIMAAQDVANRINDLSNKRLLPLEMISVVISKKPVSTQFLRATATALYTLSVDAQTTNAGEISIYRNDLAALPVCASVEVKNPQTRENIATFTLVVTFKPDSIKPALPPPS